MKSDVTLASGRLFLASCSIIACAYANAACAQSAPAGVSETQTNGDAASDKGGDIVVTGSRVITDGSKAPTPITVIGAGELEAMAPTTLGDALYKLPSLIQNNGLDIPDSPGRPGDGRRNDGGTKINIHALGSNRTLVLIDGMRMAPTNATGSVSIETIPSQLLERVDIVTGGASAVYGSDAVAGVVNFVLDKKFKGLKLSAQTGISEQGDVPSKKFGIAAGANLFGGRGHIMISGEYYERAALPVMDRPYGPLVYLQTGKGSTATPFITSINVRRADSAFGGKVQTCAGAAAACPALGQQFVADGILGPFNVGTTTNTSLQNSGGDGAYSPYSTALVSQKRKALFGRFDFKATPGINLYMQGSWSRADTFGYHFPDKLTPAGSLAQTATTTSGTGVAIFFKNNPFLSSSAQTALGNNGRLDSTNVFSLGTYVVNLGAQGTAGARGRDDYFNVMGGANGKVGRFDWNVYFGRGQSDQTVTSLNNVNFQKQYASMDAVRTADGSIKCYAATQAATAARYADCVPLNAFGPTAITQAMEDYWAIDTTYRLTNRMDNVGAAISGTLFDGWAGPIVAGISGETRWDKFSITGTNGDQALAKVDCTGLRICSPTTGLWGAPPLPSMAASRNVWEIAAEADIPLLRDVLFFKNLSVNIAGRHTVYSTSGPVNTWKVGAVWEAFSGVRFRGATSLDIRAPTLYDLFAPQSASVGGVNDLHTNRNQVGTTITGGNPDLVPEEARTWTGGVVLYPRFIPGLTLSADYYSINMKNALGQVSGASTAVQRICETSGGTHFYCSLIQRPLPFSDTSPNNFPTAFYNININAASRKVKGWDFEASYNRGGFSFRGLASYQPVNETVTFEGNTPGDRVGPTWRVTTTAGYANKYFSIRVQNNWFSSYDRDPKQYVSYHIPAFSTTDLNLQWTVRTKGGGKFYPFLNVQNLLNNQPPIVPIATGIGIQYPVPNGYDIIGRYFTFGVRTRF
jgi:iron complex outermembrane receptor protein